MAVDCVINFSQTYLKVSKLCTHQVPEDNRRIFRNQIWVRVQLFEVYKASYVPSCSVSLGYQQIKPANLNLKNRTRTPSRFR